MKTMGIFSAKERDELFPIFKKFVYLNTAATGILPVPAVEEMEKFLRRYRGEGIRHDAESFRVIEQIRENLAALVGARPEQIALTFNTSFGINVAANGIEVPPGRKILLAPDEFPANFYPWQVAAQRKKAELEVIPEPTESRFDRPDAGIIALSWVRYFDGFRFDLKELSAIARRVESHLCVDGIQGAGVLQINLAELAVSTLSAGGQKWLLSPYGTGFLYVRQFQKVETVFAGWLCRFSADGDYSSLRRYDLPQPADATRFELGTLPYHNLWAMWRSTDLLRQIGMEKIHRHAVKLAETFAGEAEEIPGIRVISPGGKRRSAIVSISTNSPQELYSRLSKAGIICAFREGNIRFSFHIYNDETHIERVLEVIRKWSMGR